MGEAPDRVHLVEPLDMGELDRLKRELPEVAIAVTCQTTLSQWDTLSTIEEIQRRWPDVEVYNEICKATQERQEAAVEAAAEVDMVIVVGSSRSSNSKRLVQVVRELGKKPAYLVDGPADLRDEWFRGHRPGGGDFGRLDPDLDDAQGHRAPRGHAAAGPGRLVQAAVAAPAGLNPALVDELAQVRQQAAPGHRPERHRGVGVDLRQQPQRTAPVAPVERSEDQRLTLETVLDGLLSG